MKIVGEQKASNLTKALCLGRRVLRGRAQVKAR